MATATSLFNTTAIEQVMLAALDLDNQGALGLKILLVDTTCDVDIDDDFLGDIGTLGEISNTGYAAGHGGAGRLTLSTLTVTKDETNDRVVFTAVRNPSWANIGGSTGSTIVAAIVHKPGTSNDSDALWLSYNRLADAKTVAGSSFTYSIPATGFFYGQQG